SAASYLVDSPAGAGAGVAYKVQGGVYTDQIVGDYTTSVDTEPRFTIVAGIGTTLASIIGWGVGGTTPVDTLLTRSATSTARCQGTSLVVDNALSVGSTAIIGGAATVTGAITHSSTVYNAGTVTNNTGLTGAGFGYFGGAVTANSTLVWAVPQR